MNLPAGGHTITTISFWFPPEATIEVLRFVTENVVVSLYVDELEVIRVPFAWLKVEPPMSGRFVLRPRQPISGARTCQVELDSGEAAWPEVERGFVIRGEIVIDGWIEVDYQSGAPASTMRRHFVN